MIPGPLPVPCVSSLVQLGAQNCDHLPPPTHTFLKRRFPTDFEKHTHTPPKVTTFWCITPKVEKSLKKCENAPCWHEPDVPERYIYIHKWGLASWQMHTPCTVTCGVVWQDVYPPRPWASTLEVSKTTGRRAPMLTQAHRKHTERAVEGELVGKGSGKASRVLGMSRRNCYKHLFFGNHSTTASGCISDHKNMVRKNKENNSQTGSRAWTHATHCVYRPRAGVCTGWHSTRRPHAQQGGAAESNPGPGKTMQTCQELRGSVEHYRGP